MRLKRILWQHSLLLLAILSLLTAVFFDKAYLLINHNKPYMGFEIDEIQRVYTQKEIGILAALNTVDEFVKAHPSAKDHEFFGSLNFTDASKSGLYVAVFRHDSLLFWSDNSVPLQNKLSQSQLQGATAFLSNGFYTLYKRQVGDYTLVGLILIQQKYYHENKFLTNEFQSDFRLPNSIQISQLELSEENRVFDFRGNYLFTLFPSYIERSDKPFYYISVSLYFLAYLLSIIYLNTLSNSLYRYKSTAWWLLPFAVIWIVIRWWMITYKDPSALYSLELFNPLLYSESFWASSLGDLLINNMLIFYLAFKFHRFVDSERIIRHLSRFSERSSLLAPLKIIYGAFVVLVYWFSAFAILSILEGLVINSSISFEVYQILEISQYTVLGYLIAGISLAAMILLVDKLTDILHATVPGWLNLILVVVSSLLALLLGKHGLASSNWLMVGLLFLLLGVTLFSKKLYAGYQYYFYTILIVLTASLTVVVVTNAMAQKDQDRRKSIVIDIAAERDLVAEALLPEMEKKMLKDQIIQEYLFDSIQSYYDIKKLNKHLQEKYLSGYFSKYELNFNICEPTDTLLNDNKQSLCYGFYREQIGFFGNNLGGSNFYFLDNQNGRINYLGWIRYSRDRGAKREISLFLNLESKMHTQQLGYPELLLEGNLAEANPLKDYHYAKYKNDRLISQSGDYPYKLRRSSYQKSDSVYTFLDLNGFSHLIYEPEKDTTIILSREQITWLDYLVFFAYIFASYYLILLIGLLFIKLRLHFSQPKLYFKSRIQLSMISMLSMSLLLIGGATVYFNMIQFEKKQNDSVREKVQSVLNELENYLADEQELNANWHNNRLNNLDELLSMLANVFYTDINLYDLKGRLLATSRSEIFDKGLQSTKMHPDAFRELLVNERGSFSHTEQIGKLEFISAYVPLRNYENKPLAYLNMPYFSRQSELKRELSTLVVALINVYVLLILFAIFATVVIANKITEPLKLVQQSLSDMELGKRNSIAYHSDDEIGSLVKEYNRKVRELAESAEKLATSEREGAWREMAKQVAHEIKNPLTPMKLSIQLLLRAWNDQSDKFDMRITKTTATLIEQIDRLTDIATEFSNFAKMPRPKNQLFDVVEETRKVVELFEVSEKVELSFSGAIHERAQVWADPEQLSRAFINLIKNAVQAIPKDRIGQIDVNLFISDLLIRIRIKDNGTGIPEELKPKIFWPNFTTKSSGTGVGLYIVQNIIKSAGGRIWFETQVDVGTEFFIELPRYEGEAPASEEAE